VKSSMMLSLVPLKRDHPRCFQILLSCVFLASDLIPLCLLISLNDLPSGQVGLDLIQELEKTSLISWDMERETLSIHRVVMKILEDLLAPQEHVTLLEKVISTLGDIIETQCGQKMGQMLAVHGHHCLVESLSNSNSNCLLEQSSQDPERARLWLNLSKHHFQIGFLSLSLICAENSLELFGRIFGESHIQVGMVLSHLASIYHSFDIVVRNHMF
jgi:hypothetical protein